MTENIIETISFQAQSCKTRVILIGGASHTGKSTLAQALAQHFGWNYRSTDKLARHPGRPWVSAYGKAIPEHVVKHYSELSIEALFVDVLSHYSQNVIPQVEVIVHSHASGKSTECLILEGSALWPAFVTNLVSKKGIKAIWLTVSNQLLQNRIKHGSNFCNVCDHEKHLIQKFLHLTLFYNKRMREEIDRLGYAYIDIESGQSTDTTNELDELIV